MELIVPPREILFHGLRAMKAIAIADGRFAEEERNLMGAVERALGPLPEGTQAVDVDALEPITPEELAERVTDPRLRRQLVQGLIVMSMIDGEASPAEASLVERYARALEVEQDYVKDLHRVAHQHMFLVRLDLARRVWLRDPLGKLYEQKGLRGLARAAVLISGLAEDPALAARARALESLPAGSLGRAYWEFIRSNGFQFPGEKGGGVDIIMIHDLTHVLSGYDTDPAGETQVAAFHAGYRRKDPFTFIFFVMLQFHLGVRMTPIAPAATKAFDPDLVLCALRRGAAMNIDLTDGNWDFWAALPRPLDEVRQSYGVPPA